VAWDKDLARLTNPASLDYSNEFFQTDQAAVDVHLIFVPYNGLRDSHTL